MLQATARAANIVGSVQEYISTELAAVFPVASKMHFMGGPPFNDDALDEWLQLAMLEPARPIDLVGPRGPQADELAQEMYWLLNLNLFVRPSKLSSPNNLRLWTLRDAVIVKFMPNTRISVMDYSADKMHIGNLVCFEILADRPVADPGRQELVQHNLVISLRWTETWTVDE